MRASRLLRAAAVLALVAVTPVLQSASPAGATTTPVNYTCTTSAFGTDFVDTPQALTIDFSVPEAVAAGDPLEVDLNGFEAPLGPPVASTNATLSVTASVTVRKQGGGGPVQNPTVNSAPQLPQDLTPRQQLPFTIDGALPAATTAFADADVLEVLAGDIVYTWGATGDMAGTTMSCSPTSVTVLDTSSVFSGEDRCIANVTCTTSQDLESEVLVNPDGLSQGQLDNSTDLGDVTTRPYDQTLTGNLDTVHVADVRGSEVGWTQSAFMATNFVGTVPSHVIPATKLSITPSCAMTTTDIDGNTVAPALPGSVCTPGTPATFAGIGTGNAVTIASTPDVGAGTGGFWNVDLAASLEVPAYQAADDYLATVTIVLTSN